MSEKIEKIILEYDLFNLPTTQHKAGLAGLLMMVKTMKRRNLNKIPEILELSETKLKIVFTKDSITSLFDDLYDAQWEEASVKTKWKKKPKRIEEIDVEKDGKTKKEKRFIYDVVVPKGNFLKEFYPTENNEKWMKLWRDMLWNTLRGKPAARNPFKERANVNAGIPSEKKSEPLAEKMWVELTKSAKEKLKGKIWTQTISSPIYIGAEMANPEKVKFQGEVEENLLLHFWLLTTMIFTPYVYDRDGKQSQVGFVLVIPEPYDLISFAEEAKKIFSEMKSGKGGLYPVSARITIPEEGGLEYLRNLTETIVKGKAIRNLINTVEIYHLVKQGNNINLHSFVKVVPASNLIDRYNNLNKQSFNPLYRGQRIKNLLSGKKWYADMNQLFEIYPSHFFVKKSGKTNEKMFFFGSDIRKIMKQKTESLQNEQEVK